MSPLFINLAGFTLDKLDYILSLYTLIVIASVVVSWVDASPYNPIVRVIYSLTEPLLDWIRRSIPVFFGGLDFSPLILILGIQFVQQVLIRTLEGQVAALQFR